MSPKQAKELALRASLKRELIEEYGAVCMICGNAKLDWRGLSLAHVKNLGRGGKTKRSNCLILCYPCHEFTEKHPERIPLDIIKKYGIELK